MSLNEFITTSYGKEIYQISYSKKRSEMQELKTKWYFCINTCSTMSHHGHFDYAPLS